MEPGSHLLFYFILSQKTWSSGPGQSPSAMPWICCKRERNDGILEWWNAGFSGLGSIFI